MGFSKSQMQKNLVKSRVKDKWFVRNFGMSDLDTPYSQHITIYLI